MSTNDDRAIRKGFIQVDGRHVHYRVCGAGPAVVMLHDSPRSSVLHLRSLREFGDAFTVYALDTPGYGQSDPLPGEPRPTIDDFADALASALLVLGLRGATVYAFHTSSKIAAACASRHPGVIGHLLLDGISIPAQPSPDAFIERYMSPFVPDTTGACIGAQWTKVRDLHRYFPWFDIRPGARMPTAEPSPGALHEYVLDFFSAGSNYAMAYSAAMRYAARPALESLTTPTTVMARADDVLYGFLDAVEKILPACGVVERVPADDAAWRAAVRRAFAKTRAVPATAPGGAGGAGTRGPLRFWRSYQRLHGRDLHVRQGGAGRAVVMLHAPPGSAADLEPLALRLVDSRRVWAPDLPGCAMSDPLPGDAGPAEWSAYLLEAIDAAGIGEFDLHAVGLASPLALELAHRAGSRVGRVVLDGGLLLDTDGRTAFASRGLPALEPSAMGTQVWEMFQRLRDEELQWPWYDGSPGARRGGEGLVADRLHRRLVASLMQLGHYADACRAALRVDPVGRLRELAVPVVFLQRLGDPYYAGVPAAAQLARSGSVVAFEGQPDTEASVASMYPR